MKKWRAFMDKYYPEDDKNSSFNAYGYGIAQNPTLLIDHTKGPTAKPSLRPNNVSDK